MRMPGTFALKKSETLIRIQTIGWASGTCSPLETGHRRFELHRDRSRGQPLACAVERTPDHRQVSTHNRSQVGPVFEFGSTASF
jgi:hypothetical protein